MLQGDPNCVACLWSDSLHGQNNLELHLARQVAGRDLPEGRLRVYLVGHDDWPEHLEKVLSSVNLCAKVHALKMIGNYLKYWDIFLWVQVERGKSDETFINFTSTL